LKGKKKTPEDTGHCPTLHFCIAEIRKFCNAVGVATLLTISGRGSVTLPAQMRKELGMAPQSQVIVEITRDGVLLRPAVTLPVEMYSEERIRAFEEEDEKLGKVLRDKGIS
jgi:AbrB family looped-hinge helix DNA binding protein